MSIYFGLFSSRYQLKGRDWVKSLSPEDLKVFVDIGLQASGHGQKGGRAVYLKRGKEYMSNIGRRGAIVTNIKKAFLKAIQEETERELGVTFDF